MGYGPLALELIVVLISAVFLFHKYGDWRKQHPIVSISVLIGWYFAFLIVFLIPLDVALTFYRSNCPNYRQSLEAVGDPSQGSRLTAMSPTLTETNNVTFDHDNLIVDSRRLTTTSLPGLTKEVLPPSSRSRSKRFAGNPKNHNGNGARPSPSSSSSSSSSAIHTNVGSNDSSDNNESNVDESKACRPPGSYVPKSTLLNLWRVVYWTSQALTWLILPIMQSYANAGDFTGWGKLKTAMYENAIFYGSYLLIFAVLLVYAAAEGVEISIENFKMIGITASNTWGLFLLVLLLGYGLVEVPRQIWHAGTKGNRLKKVYFDLEKLSADKNDAEEAVRETYRDTQDTLESLRQGHPFRENVLLILRKFPVDIAQQLDSRRHRENGLSSSGSSMRDTDAANLSSTSEKSLVRLHKRVIVSLQSHTRTQAQWKALVNLALHLEEVVKNENTPKGGAKEFVRSYPVQRSALEAALCTPTIEWYWECRLKRNLLRALSVLMALMTVFIVWSECTFFSVHPMLSLAALTVHSAATNFDYTYIQLSSIVVISYMCVCAYYTVFKLKIYKYYHLDPHHQTDANSLIFSAMLLCRLTPPLCLNFLGMIHLDSHVTSDASSDETAFTSLMGHLDLIKVVSKGLNVYFPIAILLLCCGTYFRLGTRILHELGIDQFVSGDDELTTEMIEGGKSLLQTERNRINRQSNRAAAESTRQQNPGSNYSSGSKSGRNHADRSLRDSPHRRSNLLNNSDHHQKKNSMGMTTTGGGGGSINPYSDDSVQLIPEMEQNEMMITDEDYDYNNYYHPINNSGGAGGSGRLDSSFGGARRGDNSSFGYSSTNNNDNNNGGGSSLDGRGGTDRGIFDDL